MFIFSYLPEDHVYIFQLAISPQQTVAEPVLVQNDTFLTLKVEGIIQHGSQPGLFRGIQSISITVTSNIVSKTQSNSDQKVEVALQSVHVSIKYTEDNC